MRVFPCHLLSLLLLPFPAAGDEPPRPQAPAKEESAAAPAAPGATRWVFSWGGWNGLSLGVIQDTKIKNPSQVYALSPDGANAAPLLDFEELKLTSRIGGQLAGDAAAFHTTGNLGGFDDGFEVRRARLFFQGEWIVVVPLDYRVEFGLSSGKFILNNFWILFPDVKFLGRTQVGQFQPPQGLDVINSSWVITFMEPAAPLQALAPGTEAGLQIGKSVFRGRATWWLGIFGNGAGGSEYGVESNRYGTVIGRATWLPLRQGLFGEESVPRFLHVGLSGNYLFSSSDTLRYRSRPESDIAPYAIDTGEMPAHGALTLGAEAAWVNGPFSFQAEFLHSWVDRSGGETLNLGGYYFSASWFLTGESRPFDATNAEFTRVHPHRNFDWKAKTWGAVEVAARYSFTNLTNQDVQGGRLNMLMGGLNWYLTPNVRWYLDAGWGRVTGTAAAGSIRMLQARLAVFM